MVWYEGYTLGQESIFVFAMKNKETPAFVYPS